MKITITPPSNSQQVSLLAMDYVEVLHDTLHRLLIVRWLRPVKSHEYRFGIEETGRFLLAFGLEKLLVNNQRMGVLTMDDQGWLASISIEVISKSNLEKLAIISSTDFLQQFTNETLDVRVKQETPFFDTQYFLEEQEGIEWLTQG
ncbi:hypothetical protein K3G39_04780 [Pontibacter sp. HSC-14F20]|uniref:hypothetical protein n=1 Tax=Pontibacter sp. HSC-14F20 TaxID=2864136 RepID=UPI001C732C47|nr:hypothetical protein [Pontibacter sp. HSC-14F20]MBX0332548.1 hypothetical protein [Pontibacter sp. HSC-14F20]